MSLLNINSGSPSQQHSSASPTQQNNDGRYSNVLLGSLSITSSLSPSSSLSMTMPGHPSSSHHHKSRSQQHLYVLPVLLLEFLALALTRAVLPGLLLESFGDAVYGVMGCADCIRGLLAFWACPLTGKLSDVLGRRVCLLVTVLGTCAPVCSLAFFTWEVVENGHDSGARQEEGSFWAPFLPSVSESSDGNQLALAHPLHPYAIPLFVVLLSLSGVFSSTFTLVFAYISDTVVQQEDRVAAYGLALATFGLSFTIGPMAGGYLARYNTQYVFVASLVLTLLDIVYIHLILPESRPRQVTDQRGSYRKEANDLVASLQWNPVETLRLIATDSFLRKVAQVAFFYYTGLWALISTLSVYAVKRFHLSPERLGELMSALGLSTMVAEAVLVRLLVPLWGEKSAIKIGLVSFALQCIVLGLAYEGWHLFVCAAFSLLGNLVYPSLSSLVSGNVEPDAVGEALGAVNGIKALTEGIGPLVFGSLMTLSERSTLPGWPYLLASLLAIGAYRAADDLPDAEDEDYIHELERKRRHKDMLLRVLPSRQKDDNEELANLLSDIDESEDDESGAMSTPQRP